MTKVSSISRRKSDHININLEQDVGSTSSSGLEQYSFFHEALPEISLRNVTIETSLFEKILSAPILISSMTGGTDEAKKINQILAEAAQACNIAMGVGSQRIALDDPSLIPTFAIARRQAPDILLFANIGAVQLNYGYSLDDCRKAVDMLQADGLILHLNPLQEALQEDGNSNFEGLAAKLEYICRHFTAPVIAKEVGWGISERTARLLANCGVSAIDVAGAGGTSWSQVEMHRAPNEIYRQLAATFSGWGIPTSQSILNVKACAPKLPIIASGGITNGLDIAKCIALGAKVGGMAGKFLKSATEGTDKVIDLINITKEQIRVSMFAAGVCSMDKLAAYSLHKS